MATRRAWVLNLDADIELGEGGAYEPSARVQRAMKPHVDRLSASLLGPHDLLLSGAFPPGSARGFQGRAFCPTPWALARLRCAGAYVEPHPAFDVLRRVNSRAFASALGGTMPDADFVTELGLAQTKLANRPAIGDAWRVKHAFGMAGRGQRVLAPGPLDSRAAAFLTRGMAQGGVQIEPNVRIETEYAMHGFISADGGLSVGAPVRQHCDASGAWRSTERAAPSHSPDGVFERLAEEVRFVAGALWGDGFFGPFGVDAYTYLEGGHRCFQPRSEINARYSMGFATGFDGFDAV